MNNSIENKQKTVKEEVYEMMDLLWAYAGFIPEAYLLGDNGPVRIELDKHDFLPLSGEIEESFPDNMTEATAALADYIRDNDIEYCLFLHQDNQAEVNQFAIEQLGAKPCGYAKVVDDMRGEEIGVYILFRMK